ncbi:hypothetical protein V0U79_12685 [Hyphobacterium sp. HN65]|uniref:Uncharacterized protein n=1 Tax=Hyphobacterium lacteum TaxID=3116575 RepID=A0ABU7LUC6_9PROT|nr:hypothetical protein [Hyphobacterium sp. HN65]MEE2527221.1 hypothetical protein [Hyphobacterium sp. HN65]
MDFLDIGATAVSGGVLGTLGTALGRVTGYFERRAEHHQERERWQHELQLEETRARHAVDGAELGQRSAQQTASYSALAESQRNAAVLESGYPWVAAVRALVRPVLTPFLWLLYLIVFFSVMSGAADQFLDDAAEAEFVGYFIANIAFTASAATLWWFGDRARQFR